MTLDEIKVAVANAINNVLAETPPLIFDDVHERSTAHRLAVHLDSPFPEWNVDASTTATDKSERSYRASVSARKSALPTMSCPTLSFIIADSTDQATTC